MTGLHEGSKYFDSSMSSISDSNYRNVTGLSKNVTKEVKFVEGETVQCP